MIRYQQKDFFLTYFEESTDENAVTDDLRELQSMVSQIKDNRKVGLSYMRAYEEKELLKRIYHNQGLEEGLEEGRRQQMISVIMQQMNRGKSTSQIADFLDMDVAEVQRVYDVGKKYAPDYDLDAIYKELYYKKTEPHKMPKILQICGIFCVKEH